MQELFEEPVSNSGNWALYQGPKGAFSLVCSAEQSRGADGKDQYPAVDSSLSARLRRLRSKLTGPI